MFVVLFSMRLLEVLFFVGIAGSAVVVLTVSFQDVHELFNKTKPVPASDTTSQ